MSLFGHLAFQFAVSPENLATEALAYVLRSPVARRAFTARVRGAGVPVPEDLSFRTQAAEGGAIPDMAGRAVDGEDVVLVEAKFWAGLTENQPRAYLECLPANRPSLLLFIVPVARLETLWPELRRLTLATHALEETRGEVGGFRASSLGDGRHLGICSWRALLGALRAELDAAGEYRLVGEVEQLRGLCDRMDAEAFQPVRPEDVAPTLPRRILQYAALAEDVAQRLAARGIADLNRANTAGSKGYYRRYLRIKGHGCSISLDYGAWATRAETPLWLLVKAANWTFSERAWSSLLPLSNEDPPRLFRHDDHAAVPLHLKMGAERGAVLDDLVEQVARVAEMLEWEPAAVGGPEPGPEG